MVTHGYLWNITHQVIQPVIQPCQNVDGVATLSEYQKKNLTISFDNTKTKKLIITS